MFEALDKALARRDALALQKAIFDLGMIDSEPLPDEISFRILDALQQDGMFESDLAAHLLNHFQFHRRKISDVAKEQCIEFLRNFGDRFSHVHSHHVVAELREGRYLDTPNDGFLRPRRKPRRDGA